LIPKIHWKNDKLSWNSRQIFNNCLEFHDNFKIIDYRIEYQVYKDQNQPPFGRGLYFAKGKKECDFILIDRDRVIALIQVCWSIENPDTLKREIDGLIELSSYFKCDRLMLITSSDEKELNVSGLSIKIVSAWKLLLQNNLNI